MTKSKIIRWLVPGKDEWQRNWLCLYWRSFKRLYVQNYTYKASSLAFWTLFTIVPLISILLWVITIFPVATRLIDLAREYIVKQFIPHSGNTIAMYINTFSQQAAELPTWGFVFLVFTVLSLALSLEDALSEIWPKEKIEKRILAFVIHWLLLIVTPFLIGISVLVSSYIFSLSWFLTVATALHLNLPLLVILPFFFNIGIFTLFYLALPSRQILWADRLWGACTAAVLFEVSKKAFALFLERFHNYEVIYGAFASVPIFLLWLYISWVIVLWGALFMYERCQRRASLV